jgi:phosphoglycolate phosphatase
MPRVDLAIFDLDGTLIDSKLDLACAVNATRAELGKPPLANDTVYSYVGNGAPVLIRRAFPDEPEETVAKALKFFLAYYKQHPLVHTTLYPGTHDTLDRLRAAGVRSAVLTNKPLDISVRILEGLGVAGRFVRIYGGESFSTRKPDPAGVEALLHEFGVSRSRSVMVGDSAVDMQTARNASIRACGVTYGFQPETLAAASPDLVLNTMSEVCDWILSD